MPWGPHPSHQKRRHRRVGCKAGNATHAIRTLAVARAVQDAHLLEDRALAALACAEAQEETQARAEARACHRHGQGQMSIDKGVRYGSDHRGCERWCVVAGPRFVDGNRDEAYTVNFTRVTVRTRRLLASSQAAPAAVVDNDRGAGIPNDRVSALTSAQQQQLHLVRLLLVVRARLQQDNVDKWGVKHPHVRSGMPVMREGRHQLGRVSLACSRRIPSQPNGGESVRAKPLAAQKQFNCRCHGHAVRVENQYSRIPKQTGVDQRMCARAKWTGK